MTGVRGMVDIWLAVNGRLAAQSMSMLPIHSVGPCLHTTSEVLSDTLGKSILGSIKGSDKFTFQ